MNIATWLQDLGLERYAKAFEDNDVDAHTLPRLTEADLSQIGVSSVGHRRRLMNAIAALARAQQGAQEEDEAEPAQPATRAQAATPARPAAPTPPAPPAPPAPAAAAERPGAEHRQLTVLCCDMVGSTALSQRLHPEDMREAMQSFRKVCTRAVADYDGFVANFIGDCVLAYFGWPRAHEDDGERAVRAGRAMLEAAAALVAPTGESLAVRVGITTGAVVVGDLVREGPAQSHSAVGSAPELAEQLQSLAAPGQVVIDELTRRLLPASFALQPLGGHALNGIPEPVLVYAVSDERQADSRFDALKGKQLAPMLGRDQELALLLERWTLTQGGEGQAVLLVGEAGIGKSRLARALLDAGAVQSHGRMLWQCSPYHTGSALWPLIQRLGRSARLDSQDSNDIALDKLEAMLGADKEAAALYAPLLGLDGSRRYGPPSTMPQMQRERTLELLVEQLFEIARQRGLLLVVEDAHWVDPTTLELIERCLERIDNEPMLILITSRPDKQPALGAHPSVTRLSLNRLSRASMQAIVARLGGEQLQPHTRGAIVAQSDGVPLFAEELTKAVLETGEAAIPASLHGSLMARLDHIPEAKEVAQIAACIGREFDSTLLQAVSERPEKTVVSALDKLAAAELIFRRGDRANPQFTFKHALVQEAACESLLRGKRQEIHARILQRLEAEHPQPPPEILAQHAEQAQQADKAIASWGRAGESALAKSAYAEAMGFLNKAIELIRLQADGIDRRAQELQLQVHLGQACAEALGFGAEATRTAFTRADELLESDQGKTADRLRVQYGLWLWYLYRGELNSSLQLALTALSEHAAGTPAAMFAERMVGTPQLMSGQLAAARDHFERALAVVDSPDRSGLAAQFGFDPGVATLYLLGWLLCLQGHVEQGRRSVERARSLCDTATPANTWARLHLFSAWRAASVDEHSVVRSEAEKLAEVAARHRLPMYGRFAEALLGWAAMADERPPEASVLAYEKCLHDLRAGGTRIHLGFLLIRLASALAASGRQDEALDTIEIARIECDMTAQTWCEAEMWRVRGELMLRGQRPDRGEVAQSFERALAVAREQGARVWELRAATSLARLWSEDGERARARELVEPIVGWFTEGLDIVAVREAKALLGFLTA